MTIWRNLELIFIFWFACIEAGVDSGSENCVGVREMEQERGDLTPGKRTSLVSFYIKMQAAFCLNLALCFSQCL